MDVMFKKINKDEHELRVQRRDKSVDHAICETRSFLIHDLTHFAVESEAGLNTGFWGLLASGKSLAQLNDRTGQSLQKEALELMSIEKAVAILQGLAKGLSVASIAENIRLQTNDVRKPPEWLTEELMKRVDQRLRSLLGQWKATRFGETMRIVWEG